jgi:hypothetical protein
MDVMQYEMPKVRENLFVVFGTMNFIEMILPLHRELPLSGLEWTFVNYTTEGDTEKLI